jgi:ferritin-like metal-binding protein YciE
MASLDSLDALLEEELRDLYDAEKQLTKALPKLAKKASAPDLKEAFEEHLQQTEEHVARLERAFEALEVPARAKKCVGMRNLIKEGDEQIGEAEDGASRDAIMIAAAQKVEHYEIASYGTARTWAAALGNDEVASLLMETLDEEKEADQRLTGIAEGHVNQEAGGGAGATQSPRRRNGGTRAGMARAAKQQAADRGRRPTMMRRGSGGNSGARSRARSGR